MESDSSSIEDEESNENAKTQGNKVNSTNKV